MTNNKAREINSPVIKQLINETTPEELTKIDTQMTNNKQQTAVDSIIELCQEFLADRYSISHDGVCSEIIRFCQEQAKEMEKEQIRKAYCYGEHYKDTKLSTDYYNETYGGNK